MSEAATLLQQLSFTEYEARAYIALLQRSPLNGYELAKDSGIPRANIYAVLQRLEERGAVVRLDAPGGTRYRAVVPSELMGRIGARVQTTLERAQQALSELVALPEDSYVWNLRDHLALVEHARALVSAARGQLLVAITPPEAQLLGGDFAAAEGREVRLVTLCMAACPQECGSCRGQVYRYRITSEQQSRWLMVVADDAEVVAGELDAPSATTAIRTTQPLLVHLVSWYIRHSIALAAVLNDLGDRLEELVRPETRAILRSVELGEDARGWLETMRTILQGGEGSK